MPLQQPPALIFEWENTPVTYILVKSNSLHMNIRITIGYIIVLVALVFATLVTSSNTPFNLLMLWLAVGMGLWTWQSLKDSLYDDEDH